MRTPCSAALTLLGVAALAACSAGQIKTTALAGAGASAQTVPAPGGTVRRGDSFAMMSEQYTPRAGPYAATGASAWVAPAPAPAFVVAGPLPQPDAPAPDPIAAAISRAAEPAADLARPEAAPEAAGAVPDPAVRAAGLALFDTMSCGTCHIFADANASGSIGPSLDSNPRLTREYAIQVIGSGQGAMPSFAGQMTEAEIATLADYIVAFSRK